jgi:hypothetical protein
LAGLNANGSNLELTLGRFWQKYAAIRQALRPVQVGRGDCITMVVTFASPSYCKNSRAITKLLKNFLINKLNSNLF